MLPPSVKDPIRIFFLDDNNDDFVFLKCLENLLKTIFSNSHYQSYLRR